MTNWRDMTTGIPANHWFNQPPTCDSFADSFKARVRFNLEPLQRLQLQWSERSQRSDPSRTRQ